MKPLYSTYWSLGEGKGIRCAVFPNFLELRRIERNGSEWKEVQRITLPKQILEKLYIRLPKIHSLMRGDKYEREEA